MLRIFHSPVEHTHSTRALHWLSTQLSSRWL